MGHHRPLCAAGGAVPRAGRGPLLSAEHAAAQHHLCVHALPLVRYLRHRLPVVLPQFAGK